MAEIQQTIATVLVFDVTGLSPIFSPNTSACAKYPSARRNTPIDAVLLYVSSGGAMVKDEESLDYWWFANEWKRRSFESSKQGQ
ncbi:hypothetical protein BPOR_0474g00060 [Botrytis porri]|uniref:Uncharacterized protein n=1 Tax=Botrytis porri TaxID=87229 RepID=A0A4Z1KKC8_9HELO|nr:hypothetical protein BPOR_0474g00060 [Botrytis porri]